MTFYINKIHIDDSNWKDEYIGLFNDHEWEGQGNFCGWYGQEFFKNTTLIAYGIQTGRRFNMYLPKYPFDGGFKIVNQYYDEIGIGSCFYTRSFEADSVEEAIKIFKNQEWE